MDSKTTAAPVGVYALNEKGAPALSVLGATYHQTFEKGERGARLTTLSSQLLGPRIARDGKKPQGGPMKPLAGGIARDTLTAEMDVILDEGRFLGPEALQANLADLFALAFEVGDIREGRGERKLMMWMLIHLAKRMSKSVVALLRHIPHFASWKHLALLYEELSTLVTAAANGDNKDKQEETAAFNSVRAAIASLWARQLDHDEEKMLAHHKAKAEAQAAAGGDGEEKRKVPSLKLSLAGKWAPRVDGAFDRRCGLARQICAELDRLRAAKMKKQAATAAAGAGAIAIAGAGAGGSDKMDEDDDGDIVMFDSDDEDAAATGVGSLSLSSSASSAVAASSSSTVFVPSHKRPFAEQNKTQRGSEMRYRKLLSALSDELDVVERKMTMRVPVAGADHNDDAEMEGGDSDGDGEGEGYDEKGKGSGDKRKRQAGAGATKGRWDEIDPSKVPSKANKKYRVAFLNATGEKKWSTESESIEGADKVRGGIDTCAGGERSQEADRIACKANFLEAVKKTLAGGKGGLKAGRLQPHELVKVYLDARLREVVNKEDGSVSFEADVPDAPIIEALWAALVADLKSKGSFQAGIPLVDVSGSMSGLPMEGAIAFGILMSSLIPETSPFHGKFITFEDNPKWVDISHCKTFAHAVQQTKNAPWGGTTNFGKALQLVLETLQKAAAAGHKVEDMPEAKTLWCFTDMNFDVAFTRNGRNGRNGDGVVDPANVWGIRDSTQMSAMGPEEKKKHAQACQPFVCAGRDIRLAFEDAGFAAPRVMFWNLRTSGNPTFQAQSDTPGVAMLSGFSQAILQQFMNGEELKPEPEPEPAPAPAPAPAPEVGADGADGADGRKKASSSSSSSPAAPVDTPWDVLRKKLGSIRYDRVRKELERKGEGLLKGWRWEPSPSDRAEELRKIEAAKKKAEEDAAKQKAEKEEAERVKAEALAKIEALKAAAAAGAAAGAGAAK